MEEIHGLNNCELRIGELRNFLIQIDINHDFNSLSVCTFGIFAMQTLTLSKLIGQTIDTIHCTYKAQNEFGLQEFYSFIKLSNGTIFSFPHLADDDFIILNNVN